MEVILLERVAKLGQMGETVRVRDGYARNFLLARGKALRATEANKKHFETQRAQIEANNLTLKKEAEAVAETLNGQVFVVIRQAGESGHLYGSVAPRDIAEAATAGVGASTKLNMAFPQMVEGYDGRHDPRQKILSPEEMKVFVDTFTRTGFTGGINWYRNMSRNWERAATLDHTVRVPSLMVMAEDDAVLPPSAADGMEKIIPDLEKYLIRNSGHWTHQEQPEELSNKLIEWRRRKFG